MLNWPHLFLKEIHCTQLVIWVGSRKAFSRWIQTAVNWISISISQVSYLLNDWNVSFAFLLLSVSQQEFTQDLAFLIRSLPTNEKTKQRKRTDVVFVWLCLSQWRHKAIVSIQKNWFWNKSPFQSPTTRDYQKKQNPLPTCNWKRQWATNILRNQKLQTRAMFYQSSVDAYGFERPGNFDYDSYERFMETYLSVLQRRAGRWKRILGDEVEKEKLERCLKVESNQCDDLSVATRRCQRVSVHYKLMPFVHCPTKRLKANDEF